MARTQFEAELVGLYARHRPVIERRLAEFRRVGEEATEEGLFRELVFCLFTPQSKARSCWAAVECLCDKRLLLEGGPGEIARELCGGVRFHHNKSRYVVEARELFTVDAALSVRGGLDAFEDGREARDWLARTVKGLGLKEASHFLRNIGRGDGLAILDRHILRNLARCGVIEKEPRSLTARQYRDTEQAMIAFAEGMGMPVTHLDLLLWCRETGEVFK